MIKIPLFGEQTTLLQDWLNTDKHCLDVVPVGSGKTFLASIALPIMASDERYHKGKDIIYSAPTTAMIKALIWEPLKKTCREHFGLQDGKDINNSELTIKFPNGIFIRCKSAEQRENLRGLNVGVWIADEASLYTADVLQETLVRLRPKVGQPETAGRLIIISTPHGNGPLYDLYLQAKNDPHNWIVRHYNYQQMRSGNRDFIMQQKRILSPLKFAQDYMCSWESVEDQFFYAWNSSYIKPTVDRGGDLYTFHDWNKRVMNAIVAQVSNPGKVDGKIEVLRSYSIPNCGTEQMAQSIRADYNHRNIFSIIDMSGSALNRDTTSAFGITDRTIIEKYGFRVINSKKSNPLVADTDNSSNSFIARGGLVVPPGETKLIEALNSYHYEDASRKKLVKSMEQNWAHVDGLGDCMRYGIHHLFPIRHDTNSPNYVSDNPNQHLQPGSQYMKVGIHGIPGAPTVQELLQKYERGDNGYDNSESCVW